MSRAYLAYALIASFAATHLSAENSEAKVELNTVEVGELTIAYEVFGNADDPTILLIQGSGTSMLGWPREFCQQLADEGFRAVRFDHRDTGHSTKILTAGQPDWEGIFPFIGNCSENAPLAYTFNDLAQDAVGLMDALKIEKAHVVGLSMGAALAQLIAINHEDRVLSLTCLAGSTGNPHLPMGSEEAIQAMSIPPPNTEDPDALANHLVHLYKMLGSVDDDDTLKERALAQVQRSWYPEGANRHVAAAMIGDTCDRRDALKDLEVPSLIIHGDEDPLVTIDAGRELADTIPDAELLVVEGMGHHLSEAFLETIVQGIVQHAKQANGPAAASAGQSASVEVP